MSDQHPWDVPRPDDMPIVVAFDEGEPWVLHPESYASSEGTTS